MIVNFAKTYLLFGTGTLLIRRPVLAEGHVVVQVWQCEEPTEIGEKASEETMRSAWDNKDYSSQTHLCFSNEASLDVLIRNLQRAKALFSHEGDSND